jgi:hypothetical protein
VSGEEGKMIRHGSGAVLTAKRRLLRIHMFPIVLRQHLVCLSHDILTFCTTLDGCFAESANVFAFVLLVPSAFTIVFVCVSRLRKAEI